MKPAWRKQLYKASDLIVNLPPGHPAWPKNMFEGLTIAFVLPFIRHRPWQLRGSIRVLGMGRQLSEMWKNDSTRERSVLHNYGRCRGNFQACQQTWHGRCYRADPSLQFQIAKPENDEGTKWKKKVDDSRFMTARIGDMLSAPFQC